MVPVALSLEPFEELCVSVDLRPQKTWELDRREVSIGCENTVTSHQICLRKIFVVLGSANHLDKT